MNELKLRLRFASHTRMANELKENKKGDVALCAKICHVKPGTYYRWLNGKVRRPQMRNYRRLAKLAYRLALPESLKVEE